MNNTTLVKPIKASGDVSYDLLNLIFAQGVAPMELQIVVKTAASQVLCYQDDVVLVFGQVNKLQGVWDACCGDLFQNGNLLE